MKNLFLIFFLVSSFSMYSQNEDGEVKKYYSNGQLKVTTNYKNGKKDGLRISYYDNGEVQSESSYIEDKLDGIWNMYYENGDRRHKAIYKNGKPQGVITNWYKNGIVKYKHEYKNGKRWNILARNDMYGKTLYHGTFKNGNGTTYSYDQKDYFGTKGEGVLYQIMTWKDGDIIEQNREVEFIQRAKEELKENKNKPKKDDFITEMEDITGNMQADQLLSIDSDKERLKYRSTMKMMFDNPCFGNCKTGYGIYDYSNGMQYAGYWKNKKYHGKGILYQNGVKYYKGSFENGEMQGYGEAYKDGETIYKGQWRNGKPEKK